jgi:hypothetical protein
MYDSFEKKLKEYKKLNERDTSLLIQYGVYNIEGSSCIIISKSFNLRNNNDPNLIVFQKSDIITMNKNYFLDNAEFIRKLNDKEDKTMKDLIDRKIENLKRIS